MSETNTEPSTADSAVNVSETPSTPILISSSPSSTVDDETKRRKILSKLWGKGNKSSHKVRELEKSTINNNSDSLLHNNGQQQLVDNSNNLSLYSSTNDTKSATEDSSNSINSKPLAVVKPIVVVKSGLNGTSATDRTRINSETSSATIIQTNETRASTVTGKQSSSTTTDQTSNKKKKNHKNDDSKKKKTTKDKSKERDRSNHRHETDEKTNRKKNSPSKSRRHEELNDNHHKSSRYHSSSTTSASNNRRRSPSTDNDSRNRRSNRSTTSKKNESSSSKRSSLSPKDHHKSSSHHHRRQSSATVSPSPSRSRRSTTTGDRPQSKNSSSPKKDEHSSTTTIKSNRQPTESISNSKSIHSNNRQHSSNTTNNNDTHHHHKTRKSDENSSKTQDTSHEHHSYASSTKNEKNKNSTNHNENNSNRRKISSSKDDRRSHSRHRSKSREDRTNRKTIELSNSDDNSLNKTKTNHEKDLIISNENPSNDKKSSRGSSIPSTNNDHRRKSSSDYHHHSHRYDRHDSPSNYDRKSDHYHGSHRHRSSYYSNTHYVHHHHHHHYRSGSSRHHHRRRSISPRSHPHRSRYFSSTSSSLSFSPRRRSSSRTSSSSTRSSSSYSSISRTSSSRSSSRNYYHYRHDKKFRRSPTLEKLFLKASESIESVSTQKNPNQSSSATHLIPVQTSSINSDIQLSSASMNSLSEPNTFYAENFSGFSAPPPPSFLSQPSQRCLKEITTDSSTSRRLILNEVQTVPSTTFNDIIPTKPIQSMDISTNVRSTSGKAPRISRFSDIATPTTSSESILNTNIPVDTHLGYTQISENINCLSSSRRQQKRHNREVMECECTTSEYDRSHGIKACGSECLNRMLLIECGPMCPCGQWCTNRRFQRRSYTSHKLCLFKTDMKGYGLRTTSSIRKGRFLVEYVGEVIDMDELGRRNKKYKRDGNTHQYVMSLIHGTVIDSTIKGNWARYINHSCEPNCVCEKWLVNGEYRMGIFAKRDLNSNEEITIDYRFETFGAIDLANEKCYCGAPTCRGTISIKTNNNNNSNKRQKSRQPLDDDELLDYLRDDDTNEYIIPKTIDEIRQLIQIMSRTDSENVRTIELDLIKNNSQKQFELPRLFLECNGLHVLCSWMKDILIDNDDDQQQYSDEFKYHLLDFIHTVLPIKDRTIVIKNGLFDLVYKKLKLPLSAMDNRENNDEEQIENLMNSMLNHLDNPIIAKLFHIYSTWMSLKERYIIPKRKESQDTSNHHHRYHHHHHSSKHRYEENNSRLNFSTRSSTIQQKPFDRPFGRRSYIARDTPRTQEQQLSKDERRKLFEQQYEDAEKARVAAATAAINDESPGTQNEPPHKKQRTSDNMESIIPSTPPQPDALSMSNVHPWTIPLNTAYPNQMDQTYWIHQHLSQIPIDYIHSYLTSIGQSTSVSNVLVDKNDPPLPPPVRPDDENELSRIIRLPSGWSVAVCPSDSSVYFYNRQTMATSWTPPIITTPTETSMPCPPPGPLDLSPLSSAQIHDQHRPHPHHHQSSTSSRSVMKLTKHPHRHSRSHRHHHMSSINKRKRPLTVESTTVIKEELHPPTTEETSMITSNEQIKQEEMNDKNPIEHTEENPVTDSKVSMDENNENIASATTKESLEMNDNIEESISSNNHTSLSSASKVSRDHLRRNISQHVHATLKPYTKRTCKQGRIVSTDDIKYLVKKFTLAVLEKEIEKAKNEGIPLPPILTERVRLKTEVYIKKYMNKMGPVFQRHDATAHSLSQQPPPQPSSSQPMTTTTATATDLE
ncbi:unnamed protein product [Adineta steineri]|uniref:[histone H3]-lysine(36) N-trimethyltransferase n=1 Tax=Adineta steineri TaxID=433720 RepID=A0A814XRE1_9BILA|nr:unnamed protein product [Adineta steineri]CAF3813453.1 unnamed protein product [Adineta steineri]